MRPRLNVMLLSCMLATVMLLLGAVGVAFVYFYLINIISEYWNCEDGATAGAVVHAVLIIIMGNIYRYLAQVCANIYRSLAKSMSLWQHVSVSVSRAGMCQHLSRPNANLYRERMQSANLYRCSSIGLSQHLSVSHNIYRGLLETDRCCRNDDEQN